MILTQDYVKKMWTSFERQQAIERLIQEMGSDYVLPVKVDGYPGEVEGLSNNIGYLSVRSNNPEVVVDAFLEKIGAKGGDSPRATQASSGKSGIPKLKRDFTDKEKNQFLKESFETIISSLEDLTVSTEKENPQFEHEMERITSRKALFTLYKRGEQITQFKVWRGEPFGGDSICFFHGNRIDVETDSMNESFSLQEDQGALKLRTLGLASFGAESEKLMSPAEAAEYLWGIVCRNLS